MPNNQIVFTTTLGELAEVPGTPLAVFQPLFAHLAEGS